MAGKPHHEWPDDDVFMQAVEEHGAAGYARLLGVTRSAVQHRRRAVLTRRGQRYGAEKGIQTDPPGMSDLADGSKAIASEAVNNPPAPWKPEELLEVHGLNPKEWKIVRVRGNRWGDADAPKHQLRVDVIPVESLIQIPDPSTWTPPPPPKERKRKKCEPRSAVICTDHHAPHHDKMLHSLFLKWLADEQPDDGYILGDIMDFASISRHRPRDDFSQSVNEGLRAAFGILRDYRHASPNTVWTMLRGNHDDRLVHQVKDNVRGLYRITPGGGESLEGDEDEVPSLSLRRLLHLDELGIALVEEDWDRAKVKVTKRFAARHGYATGRNSTEVMLTRLAHSTVQGHTHRLQIRYRTEHDDEDLDQPTSTRLAAEAGTMAEIKDGLGYLNDPDWTQGFLSVHAWDDDDFHVAPAIYVPGRLLAPGGKRYLA